jgi:D-alanine-D-alanine ligase
VEHQKVKSKTVEDANISNQIKEICKKLFIGVNGRGYARCDLRMNDQNKVFMLEINFQAGILYPPEDPGTADIILQSEEGGHDKFMNLLIKSAFVNTSLRNKIL